MRAVGLQEPLPLDEDRGLLADGTEGRILLIHSLIGKARRRTLLDFTSLTMKLGEKLELEGDFGCSAVCCLGRVGNLGRGCNEKCRGQNSGLHSC